MAKEHLHFDRPYHTIMHGGFKDGDVAWFPEGSKLYPLSAPCHQSRVRGQKRTRHQCQVRKVIVTDQVCQSTVLNASYNCVDRWAYKHPNKVSHPFLAWSVQTES